MTNLSGTLKDDVPLCVDLDGTLILTDILWESVVQLYDHPIRGIQAAWALRKGKAAMKSKLAETVPIDPQTLPYRKDLLEYLRSEHSSGRRLVLVTATHRKIAERIAEYLGIFDAVMATDEKINLGGHKKKDALVAAYGKGGFDYIGDHMKDLEVFSSARLSVLADPSISLQKKTSSVSTVDRIFEYPRRWMHIVLRTLRVHQYAKNVLLGVPLIASHRLTDADAWLNLIAAYILFSLLASAIYIINDLHDLPLDRKHRKKRYRPLASGDLPIPYGLVLAFTLIIASFGFSLAFLRPLFAASLITYALLTLTYSFTLKRRLIVDALTLAILYTLRIVAGAAAIDVALSEWLLMFSLFLFVSLALLKRAIELEGMEEGQQIPGRGYLRADADIIKSIGTSSGLISVLVLALYINSPAVTKLYDTPQILWLLCPLLIYWITRIWILANRGQVHHDPIIFALMDVRSYVVAAFSSVILILASIDLAKVFV